MALCWENIWPSNLKEEFIQCHKTHAKVHQAPAITSGHITQRNKICAPLLWWRAKYILDPVRAYLLIWYTAWGRIPWESFPGPYTIGHRGYRITKMSAPLLLSSCREAVLNFPQLPRPVCTYQTWEHSSAAAPGVSLVAIFYLPWSQSSWEQLWEITSKSLHCPISRFGEEESSWSAMFQHRSHLGIPQRNMVQPGHSKLGCTFTTC